MASVGTMESLMATRGTPPPRGGDNGVCPGILDGTSSPSDMVCRSERSMWKVLLSSFLLCARAYILLALLRVC